MIYRCFRFIGKYGVFYGELKFLGWENGYWIIIKNIVSYL